MPYTVPSKFHATDNWHRKIRPHLHDVPAVVQCREQGVSALQPQAGVNVAMEQQKQLVEPIATASAVEYHLKKYLSMFLHHQLHCNCEFCGKFQPYIFPLFCDLGAFDKSNHCLAAVLSPSCVCFPIGNMIVDVEVRQNLVFLWWH